MGKAKRTLAVVAFTLVSCSSQMLPAATPTSQVTALRLYVTTPAVPLINALTTVYARVNSSVSFDITTGNYEAMVEEVLADEESYLLTTHLPPEDELPLLALPIGQDGIAVIVNARNPLTSLSIAQVRRIYQGRIDRWTQVDGEDQAIIVLSREAGSGSRAQFDNLVMGERSTTAMAQVAPSSAAMVRSVARRPGAIGYVSMSYLNDSVRALTIDDVEPTLENVYNNTYPLRSLIYFAGLKEPESHFRAFIGWVQSPEGQSVVAQHYAPLIEREG